MQSLTSWVLAAVTLLTYCSVVVYTTQVKGSISYDQEQNKNFVLFLNRFGVGKGHDMYSYGTVYRNSDDKIGFQSLMTLVLIPQGVWDDFYHNAPRYGSYDSGKCQEVITKTLNDSIMLSDDRCPPGGSQDYLRKIPCDYVDGVDYRLCNQPVNTPVINGQNFTFHIKNARRTEYYYLFLMTCARNSSASCGWGSTDTISISYDINLVNDHPNKTNRYTNEFPYDLQGTLTIQMMFAILYLTLIPLHFVLHSRFCVKGRRYSMHILVKVFSISLVMECLYVLLELLHSIVYASNGQGMVAFKYLGEVANQFSDWLLILVIILVGKGWQVTTSSLRWSKVTAGIWGAYILFSAVYFVWMVISEQLYPLSLSVYHSYQSWVGGIYLAYRLLILVYLLYEMRQVYLIEIRSSALTLYIFLAVCYIIWFCYLPLITLIALLINPVRRLLVMSIVYLIFDFLINFGMVVLFCPRWANKFFQFNNYINLLSQSPYTYKSLKAYGSATTPSPV